MERKKQVEEGGGFLWMEAAPFIIQTFYFPGSRFRCTAYGLIKKR